MRDLAKEAVAATEVGTSGVMKPDEAQGETLEGFQAVVHEARRMEADGVIQITALRQSSSSIDRPVLSILFKRLR